MCVYLSTPTAYTDTADVFATLELICNCTPVGTNAICCYSSCLQLQRPLIDILLMFAHAYYILLLLLSTPTILSLIHI